MGIHNLTGYTLGQYELRELLGVGGMGAVYRAYQHNLDRTVAVKILSMELANQPDYLERFNREARTSAALEHPHIVHIYDFGTQDNISYFVLQLLTGGALSDWLLRHRDADEPLPSLEAIGTMLGQIGGALDYAHREGVIHRDIKPSNVMFDNLGNAYLVDFGIAKLAHATQPLTKTGVAVGTWGFMAPEQWRAEDPVPATDQYALGVMTYMLLTGRMPFAAETPASMMHMHLNETPMPVHVDRPDLPPGLTKVLERALAKAPADRFPSCMVYARAYAAAVRDRTESFDAIPIAFVQAQQAEQPVQQPQPRQPQARPQPHVKPSPSPPKQESRRKSTGVYTPTNMPRTDVLAGDARPVWQNPVLWGIGGLVVVLGIMIVLMLSGGGDETPVTANPTETATVVPTRVSIVLLRSATPTFAAVDVELTTQAEMDAALTLTAMWWTPVPTQTFTPTVDVQPTIDAQLTQTQAVFDATRTAAAWTPTSLPTSTPLPSIDMGNVEQVIEQAVWRGHTNAVWSVKWSPDGTQLASAGGDRSVRVWDAQTGTTRVMLTGHTDMVWGLAWSPDGLQIVSGAGDGTARAWDVGTGAELLTLQAHPDGVWGVSWSPDGTRIATGGEDSIRVWDARTGEALALLGEGTSVIGVAWSPDNARIASAGEDNTIYVWDVATRVALVALTGHTAPVPRLAWSPDGTRIASASWDHSVRVWDVWTGMLIAQLDGHTDNAVGVAWSPDGRYVVSGGNDHTVRVWDAASGALLRTLEGHTGAVASVAWSPDGRRIASCGNDHTVRIWGLP